MNLSSQNGKMFYQIQMKQILWKFKSMRMLRLSDWFYLGEFLIFRYNKITKSCE